MEIMTIAASNILKASYKYIMLEAKDFRKISTKKNTKK